MNFFERIKTGTFILHRYVARSYMSAFFLALVLLSFIMSIGLLVQAAQLMVNGISPSLFINFIFVGIPEFLPYTIPLAALVSALLVFGRLSSDGEISAMRACGINIWSVMAPLIAFGVLLTALTTYINGYVAPLANEKRQEIKSRGKDVSLLNLLQPGVPIKDFPGQTFWFAEKEKDSNLLKDVRIYEYGKKNPNFTREIRAESAYIIFTNTVAKDAATGSIVTNSSIILDMNKVQIEPVSENQPGVLTAANIKHIIPDVKKVHRKRYKASSETNDILLAGISNLCAQLESAEKKRTEDAETLKKVKDDFHGKAIQRASNNNAFDDDPDSFMTQDEAALLEQLEIKAKESSTEYKELRAKISERKTEINRRWAFGLAPFAFILIGMPLGIRTSRKESNIGIAISLGIMIVYYCFIVIGKSLAKYPDLFPHILIWTPSVICAVIAFMLIRKNQ